jgi:hypothetical protein
MLSAPAIAAALGAGFLRDAHAAPAQQGDDKLLGARIYNIRDFGAAATERPSTPKPFKKRSMRAIAIAAERFSCPRRFSGRHP